MHPPEFLQYAQLFIQMRLNEKIHQPNAIVNAEFRFIIIDVLCQHNSLRHVDGPCADTECDARSAPQGLFKPELANGRDLFKRGPAGKQNQIRILDKRICLLRRYFIVHNGGVIKHNAIPLQLVECQVQKME